jgi:Tfp pilus assembly protein PilF
LGVEKRAISYYKKALRLAPRSPDADGIRKKIVALGGGADSTDSTSPSGGGGKTRDVEPADTETATDETPVQAGNRLLGEKKWRAAMDAFTKGVVADPKNADLHLGLGKAYEKMDNSTYAVRHYRKHLKYNPRSKEAERILKYIYATEKGGKK